MNVKQDDIRSRLTTGTQSVMWILAAQIAVFAMLGLYAYSKYGHRGVATAAIAGVICFVASSTALYSVALTAGTPNSLSGTLMSLVLRTAAPFFVTILLVQASKPLADTGLFGMVLVNYLVGIAVESALAVRLIQIFAPPAVRQ